MAAAAGTTIKLLVAGLLVTEAINVGAIIITASRAPALLRQVNSLNQLVGSSPPPQVHVMGRPLPEVQAVVLGDSTAAGEGLPVATSSSRLSRACGRSQDSYAQDLAAVNGWQVLNLACSGASIADGLLGPQFRNDRLDSPATGRGAASHGRVCDHRQRRRQRRWLVPDGGLLRGRPSLR